LFFSNFFVGDFTYTDTSENSVQKGQHKFRNFVARGNQRRRSVKLTSLTEFGALARA
jgi:hypothetical protein